MIPAIGSTLPRVELAPASSLATGAATQGAVGGGQSFGAVLTQLATDAVSAALSYRAQAPVLDGLMQELGLDGSSLNGLVKGTAAEEGTPSIADVIEDVQKQVVEAEAKATPKKVAPKPKAES